MRRFARHTGALALVVGLAWVGGCIHYAPPGSLSDEAFQWQSLTSADDVATLRERLTQAVLVYGDRHGSWTYTAIGSPHVTTGPAGTTVAYMLMDAMYPHTGQVTLGKLIFTPTDAGTRVRIGTRLGLAASQASIERRARAYVDILEGRPPWEP